MHVPWLLRPERLRCPCSFEGCGRPTYSHGLCQTHNRQRTDGRTLAPIRPYRPRSRDTTKFAGLRLSPRCAEALQRRANEEHISASAVIADIVEAWTAKRLMFAKKAPDAGRR